MSHHPDSPWNHAICDDCWFQDHSVRADEGLLIERPFRIVEASRQWDQCCRCGGATFSGIYVRDDPGARTPDGSGALTQWRYGYYCTSGSALREAASGATG